MFTLQASLLNHFCSRGGGGVKSVAEVTVNSKEVKTLKDFCPNDVQEFGLRKRIRLKIISYLKRNSIDIVAWRRDLDDLCLDDDLGCARHLADAFVSAAGGAKSRLWSRRVPGDTGGR